MAHENIGMIDGFFVLDAKPIPTVCGKLAGNESVPQVIEVFAQSDDGLRRWIPVAALPERIYAADDAGQAILRSIEIDCASFPVIRGEDAEMGAVFVWKRIANFGNGFNQFWPADLFAVIAVDLEGVLGPRRVWRRDRKRESDKNDDVSD